MQVGTTITVSGLATLQSALQVSGAITSQSTIYALTGIWSDGYVSALGTDTTSDITLKTNITSLENVLPTIKSLNYFKHSWKNNKDLYTIGLSAQELQKTNYGFLVHNRNGHLSVEYEKLAALALQGIKDEDEKIEDLRERVTKLEEENKELKNLLYQK